MIHAKSWTISAMKADLPANEAARLEALQSYDILDTVPEQAYDDIVRLAARLCGTPISLISLIDQNRQWFKAKFGLDLPETPRTLSLCAHAILQPTEPMVVPDTRLDPRFSDNPLVQADEGIRFYAGVPLVTSEGYALGTLSVADRVPRQLTSEQEEDLRALARQAMVLLEQVLAERQRAQQQARQKESLFQMLLNSFPQGSVNILDTQLQYVLASGSALEEAGLVPEKMVGKSIMDLYPPEQVEYTRPFFERGLAGEEVEFDLSFSGRSYTLYVSPLHDEDGNVSAIVAVAHDITERKQVEEALRQSEQSLLQSEAELRLLTESMPQIVWVTRPDGWHTHFNQRWMDFTGLSLEESLGLGWNPPFHPEDRPRAARLWQQATASGEPYEIEYRLRRFDGEYHWMLGRALPVRNQSGAIVKWFGTCTDIHELKQAQATLLQIRDDLDVRVQERTAELQQAEAETRTRARQQEGVATLGHKALTGISMDALLESAVALVTATLDVDRASILQLMPDGNNLCLRAASDVDPERFDPWRGQTVVPGGTQSHAGYVLQAKAPVIVEDLQSETRFEPPPYLLERGITNGVTVMVEGYEKPFGTLSAYSVQKRHFTRDDVNFLQAMANVLAATIERQRTENQMREMNLHLNQLNAQLKSTNEELKIESIQRENILGALQEATQFLEQARVEAEEARAVAERASAAKSEFLSRMSHELRTPLNAILGFGQILEMRSTKPRDQEAVGHILSGGKHLLALVDEVLDLARIESGRLHVSVEPVLLDRLLQEVTDLIKPVTAQYNVRLHRSDPHIKNGQAVFSVLADQQRLKQVLLNLLSNAIKYNRSGGNVFLNCTNVQDGASEDGASGNWVRLEVRDDGPGIAPEDLPRLFQPFERLQAAQSGIEGTGLGLALCQGMVHAMGGRIGLESDRGQGTTAWVEFPATVISQEAQGEPSPNAPTMAKAEDQHRVLLIEDNLTNMRLIEHLLADQPHVHLLAAMQGQVGLELAQQHEPDLILLDRGLPDISGDEVLRRLQADPATASIPVVIISADALPTQVERLKTAGAAAYLTKPLNVKEFVRIVQELLQEKG